MEPIEYEYYQLVNGKMLPGKVVNGKLQLKAVAPDLAKYSEDQPRDAHGRFGSGGGASGGSGLSRAEMIRLNTGRDPFVNKVYEAEFSVRDAQQKERGTLQKPEAPAYPKEAIAQARAEGNTAEAWKLSMEYREAYDRYSKDFDKWTKDFKVTSLQSDLAKETLDGTKAGVAKYVQSVTSQDWFKAAYGDGGVLGNPDISVRSVKSYAGQYSLGSITNMITINTSYVQNEPTIIHEIAHYAQQISATSKFDGHGVGFAETNVHLTEKIIGTAAAERLASAYEAKGITVKNG
jgi:hypothetical protein